MVGPAAKREAVAHLRNVCEMSERRACILVAADRKMIRYRSRRPPDVELRARLRELANERRRFGYRRLFILLRGTGRAIRHQPYLSPLSGGRADSPQAQGSAESRRNTHDSLSKPKSMRAGRSTSCMTSSPWAGASASSTLWMT